MRKLLVISSWFVVFSVAVSLLTTNYQLLTAYAVDSSPSADIKTKLEDFKKEIASKAAQLKQIVNQKLKDKAYVGIVKSKSETSVTLAAESGPKVVSANQDTVFESRLKSKQKFFQKTISEENYIAALGDIDETGVLTAKKIILLPTPNSELKTYLWGQVISVSDKLITIKDRNLKNTAASLPAESEVNLKDFVILTGIVNKNDIFKTDFVYVIPQGGILKPKKIAAPSAKLATPSAEQSSRTTSTKAASPSAKPAKKAN